MSINKYPTITGIRLRATAYCAHRGEKEDQVPLFEFGNQIGHALGDLIAALRVSIARLCAEPLAATMQLGEPTAFARS